MQNHAKDEKCNKISKHTKVASAAVVAARQSSKIGGGDHKLTAAAARPTQGSTCRPYIDNNLFEVVYGLYRPTLQFGLKLQLMAHRPRHDMLKHFRSSMFLTSASK